MMVLGIDPGPTSSGWTLLDFTIRSSPVWFRCGKVEDVLDLFAELEDDGLASSIGLVAVEKPVALWLPEANVATVATSWSSGDAHGVARGLGYNAVALGVNEWRMAFVGHSKRGDNVDAKVEAALRMFVRQMPKRTNVHVRDAGGVACAAARSVALVLRSSRKASMSTHTDEPTVKTLGWSLQSSHTPPSNSVGTIEAVGSRSRDSGIK